MKVLRKYLKDVKEDQAAAEDGNGGRGQVDGRVFARFRVVLHPRLHDHDGGNQLHRVGDVNAPRQHQPMHEAANHRPKGRPKAHDGRAHHEETPGVGLHPALPILPEQKPHDGVDRHQEHRSGGGRLFGNAEQEGQNRERANVNPGPADAREYPPHEPRGHERGSFPVEGHVAPPTPRHAAVRAPNGRVGPNGRQMRRVQHEVDLAAVDPVQVKERRCKRAPNHHEVPGRKERNQEKKKVNTSARSQPATAYATAR